MKKMSLVEKIVTYAVNATIMLLAVLTMLFNVVSIKVSSSGLKEEISVNGYQALIGSSEVASEMAGATLIVLGLSIIMVMCLIITFSAIMTNNEDEMRSKTAKAFGCLLTMDLVYMVIGLVIYGHVKDMMGDSAATISTGAVWPFILSLLVASGYFVLGKLLFNKPEGARPARPSAPRYEEPRYEQPRYEAPRNEAPRYEQPQKEPAKSVEDTTATLIKYKELLDAGVITEEEFSAIKAELLK